MNITVELAKMSSLVMDIERKFLQSKARYDNAERTIAELESQLSNFEQDYNRLEQENKQLRDDVQHYQSSAYFDKEMTRK